MLYVRIPQLLSILCALTAYWRHIEGAFGVVPMPVSFAEEQKLSRLGNAYILPVADNTLLSAIKNIPIQFSPSIRDELHRNLTVTLQTNIYQRVNHEVLYRILNLPNFSFEIDTPNEMPVDNALAFFQARTHELKISLHAFVDEVWILQSSLASTLTFALLKIVIDDKQGNFTQVNDFLSKFSSILTMEWSYMVKQVKLFQDESVPTSVEYTSLMKKYFLGFHAWIPQLEKIASKDCHDFRQNMYRDFTRYDKEFIVYTHNNMTQNIYAPRHTQPLYDENTDCPPLFFSHKPGNDTGAILHDAFAATKKCFSVTDVDAVKKPSHVLQVEKISCIDGLPSALKQAFFPMFCGVMTEELRLTKDYCGGQQRKGAVSLESKVSDYSM